MINNIFIFTLLLFITGFLSCDQDQTHDHETGTGENEHPKIQFTVYTNEFELFAEADPFILGEESNILSHFTWLNGFKPLENAQISLKFKSGDQIVVQTLQSHTRIGIYSFNIVPRAQGNGQIVFEISNKNEVFHLIVPEIVVYKDQQEFHEATQETEQSWVNAIAFTKEQSWKIDFSTELPRLEPFGQIIKTTGRVISAQGDEMVIPAKTNGIIRFTGDNVLEGKSVTEGQTLFTISGSGMADNNSSIRFIEAQNNYERAKAEYDRHKELALDKIISEEKMLQVKNRYDNAKAVFDNLNKNFSPSGQIVLSPIPGFVKQVFVNNGQYVDAGQPIATISQNKTLVLQAGVQQKYAPVLGLVKSANFRTLHDNRIYTLEELNGKVISYGRNAENDNYMIPVNLQVNNTGGFIPGGFVEIYLKTVSNTQALTIPNTSLLEEQGNYYVFVQINPELFEKRLVKPGATDGIKSEIRNGLGKDERIVSKGAILVKLAQASGALDPHAGHVH